MIEQVREENNIKLDLRKNDVVMAWRKNNGKQERI